MLRALKDSDLGAQNPCPQIKKQTLVLRAHIIQAIRSFFISRDFLEIETPYRLSAPAPECHIEAVPAGGGFLHTSPELYMKRLLASGYRKIFQICRCFREGERGERHLPEFTLLEWYRAGSDYKRIMTEAEEMIQFVSKSIDLGQEFFYQGERISFESPWNRISVQEAFTDYAGTPMFRAIAEDRYDTLMVEQIEPKLGRPKPSFIYDYPASRGALARLKDGTPSLAERFELYIAGLELANAFSELTDPTEQRRRFEKEIDQRRALGKGTYPMPERFLEALAQMPPSAGIALGVDRLVMILADLPRIDDVVSFVPEE